MLDRERHMLFSLNVLDEMSDKFGGYDKMTEALSGEKAIKNLKWILTLVLNEGAADDEEPLTEQQVGKMLHVGNLAELKSDLFRAFAIGTNGSDEIEPPADDDDDDDDDGDDDDDYDGDADDDEGDDEKNVERGQE